MSLLTIIQQVSLQIGLPKPDTVALSPDLQAQQMVAMVNLAGEALARRYEWQALNQEASFTTVATELQGAIATIAPGFRFIINDTIWNRTQQDQIAGPLSPSQWQAMKSTVATGPYSNYRIKDGGLYLYPVPVAGDSAYFEYRSNAWAADSGGTAKTSMTLDDDTALLDEHLLQLALRWRYLEARGLDYGEAMREHEKEVNQAMAKDGGKSSVYLKHMNISGPSARAPDGSWAI